MYDIEFQCYTFKKGKRKIFMAVTLIIFMHFVKFKIPGTIFTIRYYSLKKKYIDTFNLYNLILSPNMCLENMAITLINIGHKYNYCNGHYLIKYCCILK